jgi:hypothetical protein
MAVCRLASCASLSALVALSGCNAILGIERLDPCEDQDGDGSSTCDRDCDDDDPAVFPGQPEVCGDGRDNDCDGVADQYCQGLGTFVSQLAGSDSNPGTESAPLQTVARGIAHAQQIGHGVDVYLWPHALARGRQRESAIARLLARHGLAQPRTSRSRVLVCASPEFAVRFPYLPGRRRRGGTGSKE